MFMRRLAFLIPIALLSLLSCTPGQTGDTGGSNTGSSPTLVAPTEFLPDDTLIPTPTLADRPLLNELRYLPVPGESQFVEMKGVTPVALTTGLTLKNEAGDVYVIPATVAPTDANGIVTVYFDGRNEVFADTGHADRSTFLNAESGSLQLLDNTGAILDSITWGLDRADSVRLGNGGITDRLLPQATIGRPPSSVTPGSSGHWVSFDAPLTTPGRPNRNLCVTVLLPTHGALVEAGERILSWYPVGGAVGYRVQAANDTNPDTLIIDQTVSEPFLSFSAAAGQYTWRVQAVMADGSLADFSPTSQFEAVDSFDAFFEQQDALTAKTLEPRAKWSTLTRRVPLYAQRKDTYMLHPKSDKEDGDHAWNGPHAFDTSRWGDPADNCNCSAASISMINGYFANASGSTPYLSQDRIEVAARTHQASSGISPNLDLNYGEGLDPVKIIAGMDFALGVKPALNHIQEYLKADISILWGKTPDYPQYFRDLFFTNLKISIAANQPVLIGVWQPGFPAGHAMVATHYAETAKERWVGLNDPWYPEFRWQRLSEMLIAHYYILPPGAATARADTPEYLSPPSKANGNDSDEDGVSNFDEIIRFGTDPKKNDSDDDCVNDLEEIKRSVFDKKHGWGTYYTPLMLLKEPKSDGKARQNRQPELTPDSDGGGLADAMEDFNQDGVHDSEQGETDIFDPSDDARTIKGHYQYTEDTVDGALGRHFERSWRYEYELETRNREIKGKMTITRNEKYTDQIAANPDRHPQACAQAHTAISTMHELKYTQDAKASFRCQTLEINGDPYIEHPFQPADIISPCPGDGVSAFGVTVMGYLNTREPTSIENGKLVYKYSEEPQHGPYRIGTYLTEWEITVEKQ